MITMTDRETAFYNRLSGARAYICLFRRYFPSGSDTVALSMEQSGICTQYIEAGGNDSLSEASPVQNSQILVNGEMPEEKFTEIMKRSLDLGVLGLPHEMPSLSSSHIENVYVIHLPTGDENYFRVKNGIFSHENAGEALDLITGLGLDEFYWRKRNVRAKPIPLNGV
jgi:hypothetical protein